MRLKSLLIFVCITICAQNVAGQLYINEWMASNSSVISDPDFDNSGDWIELFNDFNDPIDISGYFLSDNHGEPTKWSIPEGTIMEPNSYKIIWADGENTGIHASFKLTKDGEEIGLYDTDTVAIDLLTYVNQKTNISMGRSTDGSSIFGFFEEPTPGFSNTTHAFSGITFYQPQFSHTGGLYDNPFDLELKCIDGEIRYTTDGSKPTLASTLYTAPISIAQTTVIRASVFLDNHITDKPVTHTYFFEPTFASRELPVISISSDPKYFWDDSIGLYVQDFKPAWEYPINIELFENDGSDRAAFNELAGTKVNGLNSWVLPQKMLGIYFDNDYDKNNLEYQLFFDKDRKRFDNFVLRASGSDWGNTLFRDVLSQGLTAETMNIEKMAFRPSIVYINGEYMGIHNMRSRIDEGFIEENFGYESTEYDLIENYGKVEEGDSIAFFKLFEWFDRDLSIQANYNAVDNLLDLDNTMDYFITEIWSSNSSWGHNIQMWKPKATGTKWRWILQDLDRSFTGVDDDLIHKFTTSTSPSGYWWARKPLRSLLENEAFGQKFAQRFTDHLYTTFHSRRVVTHIEKHKDLIDQEVPYHSERWAGTTSSYGNGIPSVSYWEGEVEELIEFANGRPGFLLQDIKERFELDDQVNLTTINFPQEAGQILLNELPVPTTPWAGKYFENMPFMLRAEPKVGQDFIGWSIAQYESLIAKGAEWKYLDDGSDQGEDWRNPDFDDSSWQSGAAKFGYGDNNETTTISFGGDSNNKHITTYFRKDINIENAETFTGTLSIDLLRDDGAIIYLNGKELVRSNIRKGSINNQTTALNFVSGTEESNYINFILDKEVLLEGSNTIAVEVHQHSSSSSDLGFDLELKAIKFSTQNFFSTEETVSINLNSDSIFVANYEESNFCTLPEIISANTTLDLSCSPYYAISSIEVKPDVTLIIEEGVEVYFPENANLKINGNLMINGSEDMPVMLTSINENEVWGGIIFHYASDISSLNYLEIENASQGIHPIYENAAISAFHSTIEMDHLTIENVENNPILTYYSDVTLSNSTLHSKVTGDLINVKYGKGKVTNTIFRGNNQIDTDAIDFDGVSGGEIVGNKIFNFLGFNSDGIDIGEEADNVLVAENFIHNCTDKGISVGQLSSLIAKDNVIVNCDKGIAIKDLSTSEIDKNTFYSVGVPVSCFEKNIGLGGGSSIVTNSIFSNSSVAPIEFDAVSQISVKTSLSDTDSLFEMSNYFANPLFESPSFHDFSLQSASIAIDGGIDADGNTVDIGAKASPFTEEPSLMISAIQYFPQGNQDAEFIIIYNPGSTAINLRGYALADAVDFAFPNYSIGSEESVLVALQTSLVSQDVSKVFMWTRGRLSNEGENIRLLAPSGIIIDQVEYNNKAPWPLEAEGNGGFLQLIDYRLDNHFAESWTSQLNTSIQDNQIDSESVIFFPNPSRDRIRLEAKEGNIEKVEIFNTFGQIVYSGIGNDCCLDIDIQDLQAGSYFIRINDSTNKNVLIVQK